MKEVTPGPCTLRIVKSDDDFIIYGSASVEIIDREGDKIQANALQMALPQLLKAARFSLNHQDILVGEIIPAYTSSDGDVYKTEVLDDRLMVVGKVWDNTKAATEAREQITDGVLKSFSISGERLKDSIVCEGKAYEQSCHRDISKIDLHAVTICEEGMNPAAKFSVIAKDGTHIIKTSIDHTHATPMEAEEKHMTEEKPASTEATGEPVESGGIEAISKSVTDLGTKLDKMLESMSGIMELMKAQKEAEGEDPKDDEDDPEKAKKEAEEEKPEDDDKEEEKVKKTSELEKKLVEQQKQINDLLAKSGSGEASRPGVKPDAVTDEVTAKLSKAMKDPEKMAKMSPAEIEAMFPREA